MNIIPHKKATSAYTFIEIRDGVRKCARHLNEETIMNEMNCDMGLADEITDFLFDNRYIEHKGSSEKFYKLTELGRRFMASSARPPITRKTADRNIEELKERCRKVNDDDEYYFKVKKVYTFGSYNTKKKRISDIDLIVVLTPTPNQTTEEFIEEEWSRGKSFNSYMDQLFWPERKTVRFLKNRRAALDIYTQIDDVDGIFNKIEGLTMKKLKLLRF